MATLSPEESPAADEALSHEVLHKNPSTEGASIAEKSERPVKKILETRVKGKVLWFSSIKKFGFITRSDTEEGYDEMDIFVHSSGIAWNNPKQRFFTSLTEGQEVLFDIEEGGKCGSAINVTGLDGKPVKRPRRRRGSQNNQAKKESVDADHKIPRKKYGAAKKTSDEKVNQDSIIDATSALSGVSLQDRQPEQKGILNDK
ncbi:hypothetical protein PRIPAC_92863 [Pristionchus pacificus]|uniref:CSD domain-containing protein n=1 Tax=Pristionchus pacificus TaxID=54126 RepID=A0A2A6BAH4_PRIPA|nr:hypothetical protein PRIPAC_92863 [Pristionchus pacificus]|eukprot:PDM62878.1 hypothetical protein PRIPAC_50093 [Pristionchus pacificus]